MNYGSRFFKDQVNPKNIWAQFLLETVADFRLTFYFISILCSGSFSILQDLPYLFSSP
jgi:hypothetical protein